MLIALDYDKTYSADPSLWDIFIGAALDRGHEIICITMRHQATEGIANKIPVEVHYTNRKCKWDYAKNNNLKIDIWIDDSPYHIFNNSF
jgi:hypothetical protein